MTCSRCGAPLPADARFCPTCGATVSYGTTPPSPAPFPAQAQPAAERRAGHPQAGQAAPIRWSSTGYPAPSAPRQQLSPYGEHPGQAPSPYARQARAALGESSITAARILQLLAGLTCLVQGVAAMTLRRAAYVDLGAGRGGSASSDQLNLVLLSIASIASVVALTAALFVLMRGRGRSPASGAGLSLFGVGWLVVLVGAALVAGADTRAEADTAAAASVLVGVGFVVAALGHILLAVGLRAPLADGSLATAPYPGPDPYAGTPLARNPADRPAFGPAPG